MTTNSVKTVEVTTFELKSEVDQELFLKVAEKMEKQFIQKQDGFIPQTLSVNEKGVWTDIIYWESETAHQNAFKESEKSEEALPFMNALNFETVQMNISTIK